MDRHNLLSTFDVIYMYMYLGDYGIEILAGVIIVHSYLEKYIVEISSWNFLVICRRYYLTVHMLIPGSYKLLASSFLVFTKM